MPRSSSNWLHQSSTNYCKILSSSHLSYPTAKYQFRSYRKSYAKGNRLNVSSFE